MESILQELESNEEAVVLKRVDFSDIRMTEIRAETLKSLSKLVEFSTNSKAKLTSLQLRTIFTEIVERQEGNKLEVLKEIFSAFSLVELLHCCALIGRELHSVEIF